MILTQTKYTTLDDLLELKYDYQQRWVPVKFGSLFFGVRLLNPNNDCEDTHKEADTQREIIFKSYGQICSASIVDVLH